ncbi:efflux RND transporter periplasmic adaptor subunit [Pontibacter sp. SGAir0037]|nr:efflux RND transporter periplasmic adaptor subunit [Pontibacter sp. SGAir0037]
MYTRKFLTVFLLSGFIALSSCSEKQQEAENTAAGTAEKGEAKNTSDEVAFSREQQQVSGIALGNLEARTLSTRIQANGQLQLPPQNKASINPLMGGVVQQINVIEGEYVQKGKVLATIQNPELIKLQEEYLTTRNQLNFAELDYERQDILAKEEVGSRKKFEQAKTDVQVQRSRMKALGVHLTTLGLSTRKIEAGNITSTLSVVAPISGYVRLVEVNIGTFAQPGQEMFEIVDNHHLHLDLNVFEKDFHLVEKGQKVLFTLPNVAKEPIEAKVFSVGKAFEGDSRMVTVHAEITHTTDSKLLPGMYINAQILAGDQKIPALPEDAVVRYKGKNYIFHQQQPTVFKMAEVETGVTENGFTAVSLKEDLPADTQFVTKGAYYILAEKMKSEVSEE